MLLWVKAFHVIFMVTWFAGLFYLPRIFVYHADTTDEIGHDRFCTMEKRLGILMSIGAALTIIFGLWLLAGYGGAWLAANGWMHAKLLLVLGLIGYHGWCQVQVKKFRERRNTGSAGYFRLMNEVPSIFLVVIVILAIVKPF
ncbi:CopD family protein [uncultured Salinisphaera sp.]|uniref:CopD family protein n=1 Tax=uncultured Salinisphaera sp. TaxID=359372 RepID=UPI0032B156EA|tara:strand:- start:703 stop:1128 length:426 start_codon:yes stop_codon:yes gene_type:complete